MSEEQAPYGSGSGIKRPTPDEFEDSLDTFVRILFTYLINGGCSAKPYADHYRALWEDNKRLTLAVCLFSRQLEGIGEKDLLAELERLTKENGELRAAQSRTAG